MKAPIQLPNGPLLLKGVADDAVLTRWGGGQKLVQSKSVKWSIRRRSQQSLAIQLQTE